MVAVICDMDGLLVDSEAQALYAWSHACAEQGLTITKELVHAITGTNYFSCQEKILSVYGDKIDYPRVHVRAHELSGQRLAELGFPTRPFAREAMARLKKKGMALAVATSTDHDEAMRRLRGAKLEEYFPLIVCGNEVHNGKPAPDIFLYTAQKLGVPPAYCAVLEDSPNGVLAANAAGMVSIWVPDQITPDERPDILEAARFTVPTLREAAEKIENCFPREAYTI